MSNMDHSVKNILNKEGIFGFGLSHNDNLDLLNIVVLACTGIIIKMFFQENYTKIGNVGPASTTIWGYGLTAIALLIMIFMSLYFIDNGKKSNKFGLLENKSDIFTYLKLLVSDTLPIVITFGLIVYIITLNFIYFTRINSNKLTDSYHTYSLISSILLIIQLGLIFKFLYGYLDKNKRPKDNILIKSASYILGVINFLFIFIIHILLAFFSTDG